MRRSRGSMPVLLVPVLVLGLAVAACGGNEPAPVDGAISAAATPSPDLPVGGDPSIDAEAESQPGGVRDKDLYTVYTRLEVEPGGYPVEASGSVVRGQAQDAYIVKAPGGAGEQLVAKVTSLEDNASFFVYDPDDDEIATDTDEVTLDLQKPGDYLIVVGPTRGNTTYELTVSISVPAG